MGLVTCQRPMLPTDFAEEPNILRFIGQTDLIAPFGSMRHSAKRRRLRTVIQELMYLAARLITTGRRLKLRFSRHCPAFTAFSAVYSRLAPAS